MGIAELGAGSCGVFTRGQALAVMTPGQVRAALTDGRWQSPWPGTYADAGQVLSPEQRAWAVVLASGGADQPRPFGPVRVDGTRRRRLRAVAAGRTAARHWGLPLVDDDDPATGGAEHRHDDVHVWSHLADLERDGRVLHRHRTRLGGDDLRRTEQGLYLLSPLRTLVDCTRLLTLEAQVCQLDHALHVELVSREQLEAVVRERSGLPWAARLRAAVDLADGRAESPHETLTRLLLLPHLPDLEPQVRLTDVRGNLLARFDLGDRRRRFAVESDGRAGHAGDVMVAKDRRRDLRSGRHGWATERLSWFDVRCRQRETVERVVARATALDPAAARPAPGGSLHDTPVSRTGMP